MKFLITMLALICFETYASECSQDAKKLCDGVEPGKNQLAKCLGDNEKDLSPACAKELKDFKSKTAKINPCFEDLAEFCVDIPTEPQKLEYCVYKHESRLSPICAADFKQKKVKLLAKDVCATDIINTCYETLTAPEGSTIRCLIKNKGKIAPSCQKNVDNRIAIMKKENPCFDETEKYCPTQVKFIEIQECLEKKVSALNPGCKKLVEKEMKFAAANPCFKDLRRHCKMGISPAEQHRCLTINENELSNGCRQFRATEDLKIKKMVELCEADRLKHCPKAPFQNGMVLKCLQENKAKLTQGCKELL